MEKFRVIIEENENGEISFEVIDFVTKTRSEFKYEDIKKGLNVAGSPMWFANKFIQIVKPIFRGEKIVDKDAPF